MDLRVIGGGAAALAFGATGFSYVSVSEVLSAEVRHVSTVPAAELQGYMDTVVGELDDAFDFYGFEMDTYVFVAEIEFSADARTRTFYEVAKSEDTLSGADRRMVAADLKAEDMCTSEDVQLFTSKGYTYRVRFADGADTTLHTFVCRPVTAGLRT